MNMTDRLIREGDPPAGQLACPVPQYEKVDGTKERVRGQDGGVYSVILGADGNPISSGNPWPVQLNGSSIPNSQPLPNRRIVTSLQATIADAVSIPAGGKQTYNTGTDGTESEVWVAINTDQQPWGITVGNYHGNASAAALYPSYWGKSKTYINVNNPAIGFYVGCGWESQGGANPTTFAQARDSALPIAPGVLMAVWNQSAATATFTVRVVRVWK